MLCLGIRGHWETQTMPINEKEWAKSESKRIHTKKKETAKLKSEERREVGILWKCDRAPGRGNSLWWPWHTLGKVFCGNVREVTGKRWRIKRGTQKTAMGKVQGGPGRGENGKTWKQETELTIGGQKQTAKEGSFPGVYLASWGF